MPIRKYVEDGVFTPQALSAMGKAFTAAVWTLGIGRDEVKREALAKVIIGLANLRGFSSPTTVYPRALSVARRA